MAVTLKGLRAFSTVLRYGSFTRAAGLLNITQPALTVQIRQLEDSLGLKLLDRIPKGAEPTAAGRELARSLEPLLQELDHTIAGLQDLAARRRGMVRLAALPSVASSVLPGAIARLRESHPSLQVRVREAVTGQVYDLVRAGEVDLGIATDLKPGGELSLQRLFEDQILAVLPPGHALAALSAIPLSALARERLLLLEADSSIRRLVDDAFAAAGHIVAAAQEAVHMGTLVSMARAGLGIVLIPSSAAEIRMAPELAVRPIGNPPIRRTVSLICRSDRSLSPVAEALVEKVREVLEAPSGHAARDWNPDDPAAASGTGS
ncbi:LysR family transcriptional regulator [Teichococcus vastitatis]|uniref:LysR substrate-binding domain-containing protein n=1 Tax=Teichococcus vastitatis TaxID=2307076 RepID=A0ABS9WAM9_9PROT|nr:LysR family transcriptional regulator [Pseudoroseomonas vastitatis]MCI0756359.1 LysR substrate-binding domain-containing protein [Pseudoroseomonas vastitatis]